jgi:hypothetical protein
MTQPSEDWTRLLAEFWAALDSFPEDVFMAEIDRLTNELPAGSAVAAFERACAPRRDRTLRPCHTALSGGARARSARQSTSTCCHPTGELVT